MYYLIGVDGRIIRELTKDELKDYFKKSGEVSGVSTLRKMGVEEEKNQRIYRKNQSLRNVIQEF